MPEFPKSKKWNLKDNCISDFKGRNYYLSNFYPSPLKYEGILYPNVECAFQAAKTLDDSKRLKMSYNINPSISKQEGRAISPLREDWEEVKYGIMKELVRKKFRIMILRKELLSTGYKTLIEGNTWKDETFGVNQYTGKGKNWLGIILMEVRAYYSYKENSK